MDPISIDLKSVAGIVVATIALVNRLKPWLGQIPRLQRVPVSAYVVVVSAMLTLAVHELTPWLPGDRSDLVLQALGQALAATGLLEWWRSGAKPIAQTHAARMARIAPVVLLLLLSACASLPRSVGVTLVQAEDAIHDAIGITIETANRLCDQHVLDAPTCIRFNEKIIPVIKDADAFNRAVASNSSAQVPAMVLALDHLARDLEQLLPSPEQRAAVIAKVNNARALLRAFMAGGRS